MKKFMVLYFAPVSAEQQMNVSPEEMNKGMEPWYAWFKKSGKALVDGGTPLVNGMHVTKNATSKSTSQATGYSILQAEDADKIKVLLKDHPHFLVPNASIEFYEMMSMT